MEYAHLFSNVLCCMPLFGLLLSAYWGWFGKQQLFTREEVGRILHREISHVSRVDKMAYDIQSKQALTLIDEFKQKIVELKAQIAENEQKIAECGCQSTSEKSTL